MIPKTAEAKDTTSLVKGVVVPNSIEKTPFEKFTALLDSVQTAVLEDEDSYNRTTTGAIPLSNPVFGSLILTSIRTVLGVVAHTAPKPTTKTPNNPIKVERKRLLIDPPSV